MRLRNLIKAVVVATAVFMCMAIATPILAEDQCGVPFEEPPTPTIFDYPVTDSLFIANGNSAFASIFDVECNWDWEEPDSLLEGRWGADELVEFAGLLVDALARDGGYAHAVVDYFSRNEYSGRDSIKIAYNAEWADTLKSFTIQLRDTNGKIYAHYPSTVEVHIEDADNLGSYVDPEDVAEEGFVHEWQHICYLHWDSPTGGVNSITEFFSKSAEYLLGIGRMSGHYDLPYDRSLTVRDFEAECERPDAPIAHRKDQGEQLGLVAHLGQRDHAGGKQQRVQRVHGISSCRQQNDDRDASPAQTEASWSKVLPGGSRPARWAAERSRSPLAPWPVGQVC